MASNPQYNPSSNHATSHKERERDIDEDLEAIPPTIAFQDISVKLFEIIHRSWLQAAGIVFFTISLATLYSLRVPNVYKANAKILFTVDQTPFLTGLDRLKSPTSNLPGAGQISSLLLDQTPLSSQMEVIQSRPLLEQTIATLDLRKANGKALKPQQLKEDLSLKIVGATDIIEFSYEGDDPKTVASVVNTLVELYKTYSVETERRQISEARSFLLKQLPSVEQELKQAESALSTFLETNGIVSIESDTKATADLIASLDRKITDTRSQLEEVTGEVNSLQQELQVTPSEAILISRLSQSDSIQGILNEIESVNYDLAEELSRFTEDALQIQVLLDEQYGLEALLDERISQINSSSVYITEDMLTASPLEQDLFRSLVALTTKREALSNKLNYLIQARSENQQYAQALPAAGKAHRQLSRQLEITETTYQTILNSVQELQVIENQATNNVRIIEPAIVPDKASSAGRFKIIGLGFISGLILASAFTAFSEIRSQYDFEMEVHTPSESVSGSI